MPFRCKVKVQVPRESSLVKDGSHCDRTLEGVYVGCDYATDLIEVFLFRYRSLDIFMSVASVCLAGVGRAHFSSLLIGNVSRQCVHFVILPFWSTTQDFWASGAGQMHTEDEG